MSRRWITSSTGALALALGSGLFLGGTFLSVFLGGSYWLGPLGAVLGVAVGALRFQRGVANVGQPSFLATAAASSAADAGELAERRRARLVVAVVISLCAVAVFAAAIGATEVLSWTARMARLGALAWWIVAYLAQARQPDQQGGLVPTFKL